MLRPVQILALTTLPLAKYRAAEVTFDWNLTRINANFDGVERSVISVNRRPSGEAAIVIKLGDTVKVISRNQLDEPVSLHWHGMHMRGTPDQDGASGITQCGQPSGTVVTYRFTPDKTGTYWWHGHVKTQYMDGLRGPLIVEEPDAQVPKPYDFEYIVYISDWYHTESNKLFKQFTNIELNPIGAKPVWDTVLINDKGRFDCAVLDRTLFPNCENKPPLTRFAFVPGKTYLFRVVNVAGFAAFDVSIDEHDFQIVATDGYAVTPTEPLNVVEVHVGQRYDLLVKANGSIGDMFYLRATSKFGAPYTSLPLEQFPKGFNPNGLAVIEYVDPKECSPASQGNGLDCKTTTNEPGTLSKPSDRCKRLSSDIDFHNHDTTPIPNAEELLTVTFLFNTTEKNPNWLGYASINNGPFNSFVEPEEPILFTAAKGTEKFTSNSVVYLMKEDKNYEIVIFNLSPAIHPMHIHRMSVHVVARGHCDLNMREKTTLEDRPIPVSAQNLVDPVTKDVFTLPPCLADDKGICLKLGYVVVRIITDSYGVWIFHCHMEWHLTTGFAMILVENAKKLKELGMKAIAPDIVNTCSNSSSLSESIAYLAILRIEA